MGKKNDQTHRQAQQITSEPIRLPLLPSLLISLLTGILACSPTPQAPVSIETAPAEPDSELTIESAGEPSSESASELGESASELDSESAIAPDNPDDDISCDDATTQLELTLCTAAESQQAEAEREATYQTLESTLSERGQQDLALAERAWQTFRDRDCDFAASRFAGGSIEPMVFNDCLTNRTATRTRELQGPTLPEVSYEAADTELNRVYQALISASAETTGENLITAQIAWIDYRDRNCTFEVIISPEVISESQCLARMSATRTEQLQITLDEQNSL
ncbi:MAG: lysozyme inhibitor LprI family protein [Cyanobacteria bacterium J06627_28]